MELFTIKFLAHAYWRVPLLLTMILQTTFVSPAAPHVKLARILLTAWDVKTAFIFTEVVALRIVPPNIIQIHPEYVIDAMGYVPLAPQNIIARHV